MSKAQSPTERPTWLSALAVAMLLYGGATLVGGLLMWRDPKAITALAVRQGQAGRTQLAPEVTRQLVAIDHAILDRHRVGVRANAGASILYGLYTLYAVAAVLSRDRPGRALAIGMAGIGILYQLGGLPLAIGMAQEQAIAATPVLTGVAGDKVDGSVDLAGEIRSRFMHPPIVYAVIGVGWCVLILVCFAGRRGRTLYGLEPERG
jgi:hypothetical protein